MSTMCARPLAILQGAQPCSTCPARSASVCAAIEDKDLERLAALAVPVAVPDGQTFITESDSAESFFNVTAGTAKLFKLLPDGRRQITGFASAGTFLGLAVSSSYAFSAEAIEQLQVCRFSRTRLRRLLDDFPAMEKRLLEVASNELVAAQEQMLLLGRKTARERVASFLLVRVPQMRVPQMRVPLLRTGRLRCRRRRAHLPADGAHRHRRLSRHHRRDGQPHADPAAQGTADRHADADRDRAAQPAAPAGTGRRTGLTPMTGRS